MTGRNLRLPRTLPLGAGEEQKNTIQQQWGTAELVEMDIAQKGLKDKPQPLFDCPELDVNCLTGPDSKQYTESYVHLLAWFNYSSELLGKVQIRVLQYENMLDILSAQTRRQARDMTEATGHKKPTAEELQDRLLQNPEYLAVLHELQRYKQAKIVLEKKVEGIERSLRVVSRQVEIRRLDLEQTRTSANMPGRGRQPFSREP